DVALVAAVPAVVVVGAVAVLLAVALVVLVVVGDQVVEGEPVVAGDEVDAVERRPLLALAGEQVVRPGDAGGELAGDWVALDPAADGVAELAVPLGPAAVGERAEAVLADAPRLGDQLDPRQDRVGLDLVDDRRLALLLLVDVDGEHRR